MGEFDSESPVPGQSSPPGGGPPPLPPSLPTQARPESGALAMIVGVALVLFLADGILSFLDGGAGWAFDLHFFAGPAGVVSLLAAVAAAFVYLLAGLTPIVPKRIAMPPALYIVAGQIGSLAVMIYYYAHLAAYFCLYSAAQVILALWLLRCGAGGWKFRWPPPAVERKGMPGFTWLNLSVFAGLNLLIVLPLVFLSLAVCAGLATDHLSGGFLKLRPDGLYSRARHYVRGDGKSIRLYPMMHVGDARFYSTVVQSFPTNSVVLMEGVSDEKNLLTNGVTYERMAKFLGLAEQHQAFDPSARRLVRADVDVDEFSPPTIDLLNVVMLIHSKGLTAATILTVSQRAQSPDLLAGVIGDLVDKRNRRVVEEIRRQLPQFDELVVPWGAAHMPEIARQIQAAGFRLAGSRDVPVIRFWRRGQRLKAGAPAAPFEL